MACWCGKAMNHVDGHKKSLCAGCGKNYPCHNAVRTDLSGNERAKHYRLMRK